MGKDDDAVSKKGKHASPSAHAAVTVRRASASTALVFLLALGLLLMGAAAGYLPATAVDPNRPAVNVSVCGD